MSFEEMDWYFEPIEKSFIVLKVGCLICYRVFVG
jgi:hypothetical protein